MNNYSTPTVRALTVILIVAALVFSATVLPEFFSSDAENLGVVTAASASPERGLPNFDIRTEKSADTESALAGFRGSVGRDLVSVDALRGEIGRGAEEIKARNPDIVVEYSDRLGAVEVISPNVWKDDPQLLTEPADRARPETLRNFLKDNASLVGLDPSQTDELNLTADYTNPEGNLSFTHFEQRINGVPVFQGEVKAGFDREGRIVRVINNAAPGLDYNAVSKNFGDPDDAVQAAAGHIGHELKPADLELDRKASTDLRTVFGKGDWATTAERMYFPTEPGVAIPSWRVLIWEPVNAYYVIVDATSGTMLWRKNITEDQTQPAT